MLTIQNLLQKAKADESHSSVSQAEKCFANREQASREFYEFKQNLFDIKCWNESANLGSYEVFNEKGEIISNGKILEDSLIRISLKGTGKYDWVKAIEISDSINEIILTVQPTFDPTDKDKKTVSHFFTAEARNNFCLHLEENKIGFLIIGLNEKQNIAQTDDFVAAIRNWVTANVGSYLGIQKGEWTAFTKNFLHGKKEQTEH
jgi:hypothetical protein